LLSEEEQKTKQLANIIVRSVVATNICPAFLFLTRSCLEGQLEGHLFFRADFARLVHGSSAFAGSMNISFPGTEVEGIAFD